MTPRPVALVLPGVTVHGLLVGRWPHYRLVLDDGSRAVVRRSAVVALVTPPAPPAEAERI